jgi:predicted O-methyltransferase YrrM
VDAEVLAAVRRLATPEDDTLAAVRSRAEQVTTPPAPEVGALLRVLADLVGVRHAVEVGAAGGVSGAWLLAGMAERGVLTCIEGDAHLHGLATAAYADLGVTDRVRAILGDPATVADRLTDDQYDLVLLQQGAAGMPRLLPQAERLLRPGGVLVARRLLAEQSTAPAELLEAIRKDPWASATVLPVDEGLLIARLAG